MNAREELSRLLSRWHESFARGDDVPPEELCRDHPELLPEVERQVRALKQMQAFLQVGSPRSLQTPAPLEVQAGTVTGDPHGSPAKALPRPSIVGYEVLEPLGQGGMGVVWKAKDTRLKRVVAIKQLLVGQQASADQLARFRTEAEAIAKLQHPHIVQVYQAGEQDGQPFFVLEFVPGGNLHQTLSAEPQPVRETAKLLLLLARALHTAHQAGVIHRDLKPANVLLAPPADEPALNTLWGCPKVTDFGLARLLDGEQPVSLAGAVTGTPPYMAPEQAEGRTTEISPATDVWALGVILYQVLTGRLPFKGETLISTLRQVCDRAPEPVRKLRPEVPEGLEAIVERCLEKRIENRYPSAAALAEDLKRFLDTPADTLPAASAPGQTTQPNSAPQGDRTTLPLPPARKRVIPWLVGAVAGLVLIAAVLMFGRGWLHPTPAATTPEMPEAPIAGALTGELNVRVWTADGKEKPGVKVQNGGVPVRNGEGIQMEVSLSRPAYVYILWADSEGGVTPIYPWNRGQELEVTDLAVPPPALPAQKVVHSPPEIQRGWKMEGLPGLDTILLLARTDPLPVDRKLTEIIGELKPTSFDNPREVAVRGFDRDQPLRPLDWSRRPAKKQTESDNALLQLMGRLQNDFEMIRAVQFAHVEKD